MPSDWWNRLPERVLREEEAILVLYEGEFPLLKSHCWRLDEEGEPRLCATLDLKEQALEVRFPPHYPDGCPSVRPVPYDTHLSSHQFVSGILCLEIGPDNWHPDHTAADMIRSAWKLLAMETIRKVEAIDIPSRHTPDLSEEVAFGDGVLLRSAQFVEALEKSSEEVEFEWAWPSRNNLRVIPTAMPKETKLTDIPPALLREGSCFPGIIAPLHEGAPHRVPTEPEKFDEYIATHSETSLEKRLCVILRWSDGRSVGYLRLKNNIFELVNMNLSRNNEERTPDAVEQALAKTRVGIVGLGSLGSKVAVSLARSGVRNFMLVDRKVITSDKVCRNEATYLDVGTPKVQAVKELIRDVCSEEPEVETFKMNLASATSPEGHAKALQALGGCDLLVDATADADAFCLLAMVASDHRRPLVWAEVYGGGLGGMVASAQPDHDPCPRCVRAAFISESQDWPAAPRSENDHPYAGTEESPVVATDADVGYIAAAATARAMDIALGHYDGPAVSLLGLRPGWIFDEPMASRSLRIRGDDWSCAWCWRTASEPDNGTLDRARGLFKNTEHAQDSPST